MTLGPNDLVLCSGTLPPATTFPERLAATRAARCTALSLWGRDYRSAIDAGYRDTDIPTMLDEHGLAVAEIDPVWSWTPGADQVHIPPELDPMGVFAYDESELLRIADVVGARSLNVADVLGGSWTIEDAAESFAALCDRAGEHGLLVHLEWLAWSKVPDLATAVRIVAMADRPNGGLTVDTWHCARTATSPADLAAVDGRLVLSIQLDDGPAQAEANLVDATLHHRLVPGDGAFDLVGYVTALRDAGARCPVGVEVFSDSLHGTGASAAALTAAEGARGVLARAGWSGA